MDIHALDRAATVIGTISHTYSIFSVIFLSTGELTILQIFRYSCAILSKRFLQFCAYLSHFLLTVSSVLS
jgi:hypothetical protein